MAVSLFSVLGVLLFYCCQIHQLLHKRAQRHLMSVKLRMLRNDMHVSRGCNYCRDVPVEQCVNIYLFLDWKEQLNITIN